MNVDKKKLELAMARKRMTTADLTTAAQLPRPTVNNVICGRSVRPATLGKIAYALDCDPADLMEPEAGHGN